ncbi:MAG: SLC13 family permease [Flammeovirgaceae bacterium]
MILLEIPHATVSSGITYLFLALLLGMVAALALEEKIHAQKSVITGVTAVIALLLGEITGVLSIFSGHEGHVPFYVTFIDWGVINIILGSSIFVDITSKSGIFSWLAIRLTKLTKGDPFKLLVYYSIMTVIFSALLNNVTAMIIVGSLTAVSLNKLKRNELLLGFLLCEGLLTNIGGLLTLISSVPNIIVGNAAKIAFIEFFYISAPYVVIATTVTIYLSRALFKIKGLKTAQEKEEAAQLIQGFDENDSIESMAFFRFSWFIFGAFIVVLATTDLIPYIKELGIGFVALAFGIMMLIKFKSKASSIYAELDWDLLFFFAFLFVVIGVMEHAQVLELIGGVVVQLMNLGETGGPLALLWAGAFASSVTDNIPLAAMLAKTMQALPAFSENFWWALIYGTNLGGNITPIGSASTVVAVTVIHKNNISLSFGAFVVKAIPFAIVQLILASAYVYVLGLIL